MRPFFRATGVLALLGGVGMSAAAAAALAPPTQPSAVLARVPPLPRTLEEARAACLAGEAQTLAELSHQVEVAQAEPPASPADGKAAQELAALQPQDLQALQRLGPKRALAPATTTLWVREVQTPARALEHSLKGVRAQAESARGRCPRTPPASQPEAHCAAQAEAKAQAEAARLWNRYLGVASGHWQRLVPRVASELSAREQSALALSQDTHSAYVQRSAEHAARRGWEVAAWAVQRAEAVCHAAQGNAAGL